MSRPIIVADTDFLSAFLKIDELEIILRKLDLEKIVVPVQVEKELLEELERKLDNNIKVKEADPVHDKELGEGERAVIALASEEDLILMNDRKACEKASQKGLKTVTIPGFLKSLNKKKAQKIADKLRREDNYIFSENEKEEIGLKQQ